MELLEPAAERPLSPAEVEQVLAVIRARRGLDLRDYRADSLMRRLAWRLSVAGEQDVGAYASRLESDGPEMDRLLTSLLVPVTSFFRDRVFFEDLQQRVLPVLRAGRSLLRVWVAGMASGEEVWSLGLLLEQARRAGGPEYVLFGSDINPAMVRTARRASYSRADLGATAAPLLALCLVEGDQVSPPSALRERVQLCTHDLMGLQLCPKEAVVADFDLVLCRNVLIYFDERLQEKAQQRLSAVLAPEGALALGSAEAICPMLAPSFEAFPDTRRESRIFRRVPRETR